MAQTTDKIPLNILLIGKAGHGKSATGNSILGRTAFKRYPHLHSGTQFVTDASAEHGPYEIKVVDGPGLEVTDLDGVKNKEQMFKNMATALRMCNGGIHAFVLVIKFGFKYTEEERQSISDLKQIFGENCLKDHGIIVMTGGDSFFGQMEADGTPGKTFKEWCHEQDNVLGNLIEECNHRVVLFNNLPTSEEEKTRQRNELLFHAAELQKVKGLYSAEDFQTYAQVRSKFIKDSKQTSLEQTRPRKFHAGQFQKEKALDTTQDFQTYEQVRSKFIKDSKQTSLEQTRPRKEVPFHAGQCQKVKALDTTEDCQTYEQVRSKFIKDRKQTSLDETRPKKELHAGQLQKESGTTCRMAQKTVRIPLNILLIGKTGHGKSGTGNTILGRKAFQTTSNAKSETKSVTVAWAEHGLYEVKVVDGPGLEDTDLDAIKNKEQACENMATALMLCNGGIHAFVLVFKMGTKYTKEERRVISDLKQIFGDNYLTNRGIIVITGGDSFTDRMEADGTPGTTFNEWCCKQVKDFRDLIEECSPRVVLFNNISKSEEEITRQRNELLFHAGRLQKEKGLYTTGHFQAYAQMRDKCIKDCKQKILAETVQKRIDLLLAELGKLSMNSSPEDVDQVDARIADVYTEIGEESLQEESMQQLIAGLKRLSTTTEEMRKEIRGKNQSAMKSRLVAMSQHQEELKKKKLSWGYIGACIGVSLAAVAVAVGGATAVIASAGSLAPAALSMAKVLLGAAETYLAKKLQLE